MNLDPLTLVERVNALGVAIRADGDALVLAPRGVVPPALRAELIAAKSAVLEVLRERQPRPGYEFNERTGPADLTAANRQILRRLFALVAEAGEAAPDACHVALQEELRLIDDLGPALAAQLRRGEARRWRAAVGACPYCGEAGTFHDEGAHDV
jgi:hypothetical protein